MMRIIEKGYDEFVDDHFANMVEVRCGREYKVWSAGTTEYLLIFFDGATQQATVFEYDTLAELQEDIELVLHLRGDDGNAGAGVSAVIGPAPPGCSAANAEPLPRLEGDTRASS